MKKTLLFLVFSLTAITVYAQVQFETFQTFSALLEKAQTEKKLIFIQIESDECAQCNDVAMKGLGSSQIKEKYQVNFVSTKIHIKDDLYKSLSEQLGIEKLYGSVYLEGKGQLLLKNAMTTSYSVTYLDWADKAIAFSNKITAINSLEKAYKNGNQTPAFLEKYILALREIDRFDPHLVDEYIGKLLVDSLQSDRIIRFVHEQGLPITSNAYKGIRAFNSPKKIDSLWYLLDNSLRVNINHRTKKSTFDEAVKTKNVNLIYQTAQFTRNIYGKDWRRGDLIASQLLNDYYWCIKDTVNYLSTVRGFVERNLMRVTDDSLKAWDFREREQAYASRGREKRIISVSDEYATALNNISWHVYLMSNDSVYLTKALTWTKRALEIREKVATTPDPESPQFLDTYAHLLYKLKNYEQAITWQKKAIEANSKSMVKTTNYQLELEKMIHRKL